MTTVEMNPEILEQKMGAAFGALGGVLNAAMVYLGDELGLYRGMNGAGEVTSGELATRCNLAERFVREWLYQQAASGIVEHRGDGRFELLPEAGVVLADDDFPLGMSKVLKYIPKFFNDTLEGGDAFRTGIGKTYDDFGEDGARQVDAMFGGWNRTSLTAEAIPSLPGVVERLRAGGKVADIGCGVGTAALAVASAFPAAEVHGYDNSVHALAVAAEQLAASGAPNVTFHNPDNDPLPEEPTFDLVMTLDCLHDMARPDLVASAIRKALKPDGTWFIVDIDGAPTAAENLAHPMAGMLFAASLSCCLQSSASTPDGLGLGTLGLPEPKMRELVTAAGFSRFQRVQGLEHPMNAYYEVRV
jgi:2-polyprenyl-3-methyl-5-hydroxy-6-metoxy-1,4-benzoquinol methylase